MELLRRLLRWLNGRPDKVMYIGGSDTLPPPLPRQEEAEWIARLERGELLARQTLIERNLRLVVYIARRFENTGINIEDLISIGTIGLIKAINTFRADKNIKLATYASRCIENEILMYLRKNSAQRTEVSFDEPLNTDWDGKELLLSDVLGTDGDVVMGPIEADVDRKLLAEGQARQPGCGQQQQIVHRQVQQHHPSRISTSAGSSKLSSRVSGFSSSVILESTGFTQCLFIFSKSSSEISPSIT